MDCLDRFLMLGIEGDAGQHNGPSQCLGGKKSEMLPAVPRQQADQRVPADGHTTLLQQSTPNQSNGVNPV